MLKGGAKDSSWLQVLVKREGFRQKPFEWNYEGLKPLLLHEVLASGRGMTLSLCILFSCVARRLGLILTPVPATLTGGEYCLPCQPTIRINLSISNDIAPTAVVNLRLPATSVRASEKRDSCAHSEKLRCSGGAGYGNEASILGVPDVPTWLLRHDGELLAVPTCVGLPVIPVFITSNSLHCCAGNMQKPNLTVSTLDTAFWDPVRGSIMDSRQCLDTYPGFPGVSLLCPTLGMRSGVK